MAEVKFVLKKPTIKAPQLVYLIFRFNTQRLKYSTGQKIHPKYWNTEKQRAKETRSFPEYAEFNTMLDNLTANAKTAYRKLLNDNTVPTLTKLKGELNKSLFRDIKAPQMTMLAFIDDLITNSAKRPNTVRNYGQTLKMLTEFKKAIKRDIDFDSIDLDFYNQFVNYLVKKGYAKNTIGSYIKDVKTFMNEAVDRGLTTNLGHKHKKFKVIDEAVDKIYLSQDEISNIYQLDLSKNKKLEKVRDLFIVGCYTGLRFSDLIQIKPENIVNNGTQIKIRTEKTNETVVIPLHRFVKEIFKKYDESLPSLISNQKMNEYLKDIGQAANLDIKIKVAITKKNQDWEDGVVAKHQLITTHTARRSFATNAYLMDIPSISIMKITGHKTEKSFMKYIKITQEENANKLVNHPFFN